MSRKIFVGSLPDGIDDQTIRNEFEKYGQVEEIFVKQGCDPGRQWCFVTFADPAQAQRAKELCDRILTFPGSERPCDVMLAKNQGMGGQQFASPPAAGGGYSAPPPISANSALSVEGPRKIFVGSLPDGISDSQLRAEFSQYGTVEDTYIKQGCEPGRQWAFVTFSTAAEASHAKTSTDGILTLPGAPKACEVTLARNQGMFGQDNIAPKPGSAPAGYAAPAPQQPKKVFVGSLPDSVTDSSLRAEFGRYGTIVDLFLKTGCEPGRQWAFITYQTPDQANNAKSSADRVLMLPGADRPVEVMLARNQGKNGADPINQPPPAAAPYQQVYPQRQPQVIAAGPYSPHGGGQPPLPPGQPPAHLTPWRTYYTAAGLPYYHNATTGVTQWECPPDLQVPGQSGHPPAPPGPPIGSGGYGAPSHYYQPAGGARYAPY